MSAENDDVIKQASGCNQVATHSGSRGIGGRIGNYFIELAKQEMRRFYINLPDVDLAYLPEGAVYFEDYAVRSVEGIPAFRGDMTVVNCHHNYVAREEHYGENVYITRKGAVRAQVGELGIILGSMGTSSYIVRGRGNRDSFYSCSHGAGRMMSRSEARRRFTVVDHIEATQGIECRKDAAVIDETPMAYKPIDKVMEAQQDLVDIVHILRQVVCVKG